MSPPALTATLGDHMPGYVTTRYERGTRVALASDFPDQTLVQNTVLELEVRGMVVEVVDEVSRVANMDLAGRGVEVVFHMHELGSHPNSERLSQVCKAQGIPVRAISRKKASWASFLPDPVYVAKRPTMPPPPKEKTMTQQSGIIPAHEPSMPSPNAELEQLLDIAHTEAQALRDQVVELKAEVEHLRSLSLPVIGGAIAVLVRAGIMRREDAATRLLAAVCP